MKHDNLVVNFKTNAKVVLFDVFFRLKKLLCPKKMILSAINLVGTFILMVLRPFL